MAIVKKIIFNKGEYKLKSIKKQQLTKQINIYNNSILNYREIQTGWNR